MLRIIYRKNRKGKLKFIFADNKMSFICFMVIHCGYYVPVLTNGYRQRLSDSSSNTFIKTLFCLKILIHPIFFPLHYSKYAYYHAHYTTFYFSWLKSGFFLWGCFVVVFLFFAFFRLHSMFCQNNHNPAGPFFPCLFVIRSIWIKNFTKGKAEKFPVRLSRSRNKSDI